MSTNWRRDTTDEMPPNKRIVILQPVVMRIPNSHNVYSLSQLRPKIEVNYEKFLSQYAKHPRGIRICFDEKSTPDTILQKAELVTAYGYCLDCWYIVVSNAVDTSSKK